jgi:hypothetical protein
VHQEESQNPDVGVTAA